MWYQVVSLHAASCYVNCVPIPRTTLCCPITEHTDRAKAQAQPRTWPAGDRPPAPRAPPLADLTPGQTTILAATESTQPEHIATFLRSFRDPHRQASPIRRHPPLRWPGQHHVDLHDDQMPCACRSSFDDEGKLGLSH